MTEEGKSVQKMWDDLQVIKEGKGISDPEFKKCNQEFIKVAFPYFEKLRATGKVSGGFR